MIEECLVVEVRVTGDDCPLAEASSGTEIEAEPPQRRADGYALLRCSVDAEGGEAVAAALDTDDRIRYLHVSRADDRTNLRCLSKRRCAVHALTDVGFMVERLRYRDGVERYTGAVVGRDVLRGVLDRAGETGGVTLERVYPLGTEEEGAVAARWDLTSPQEEALRVALESGYFEIPRESTASEVASRIGISKSAFLERLRRGQSSLLERTLG
ncbi:helix-turn-helix domain-containing protein [Natronorarus salvus]|uniref:helix-turn-helix domain-containing protein n=1 Tax=Natronorarus salvus TaxID=3117733 RepID=UPI002F2621AA